MASQRQTRLLSVRRKKGAAALWAIFLFAALGCGGNGESPENSDSSSGGTSEIGVGGTATGGGTNGGAAGSGGTENDGPTDPSEERRDLELGVVAVMSAPGTYHSVGVQFSRCSVQPVAGCEVERCDHPHLPGSHFGTLRVTSSQREFEISPSADGEYEGALGSGVLWAAGEPVQISAPGGEWEGFDETLIAPEQISNPNAEPIVISRNEPVTLRWTGGGSSGHVLIHATLESIREYSVTARCIADPSAGEATFPAAVMALVPEDASYVSFAMFAEDRRVVPSGPGRELRLFTRSHIHSIASVFQ